MERAYELAATIPPLRFEPFYYGGRRWEFPETPWLPYGVTKKEAGLEAAVWRNWKHPLFIADVIIKDCWLCDEHEQLGLTGKKVSPGVHSMASRECLDYFTVSRNAEFLDDLIQTRAEVTKASLCMLIDDELAKGCRLVILEPVPA